MCLFERVLYICRKQRDTDVSVGELHCESSTCLLGRVDSLQSDSNRYQYTGGYSSHALLLSILSTSHINTQSH